MTATERHAIRHAIPKLSAIADDMADHWGEHDESVDGLRAVVKDLLSVMDGETPSEASDGGSGPTTAQEGPEGRSGRNSGVSGVADAEETP